MGIFFDEVHGVGDGDAFHEVRNAILSYRWPDLLDHEVEMVRHEAKGDEIERGGCFGEVVWKVLWKVPYLPIIRK